MAERDGGRTGFLQDLLLSVADQGRNLVARTFGSSMAETVSRQTIDGLLRALLSNRGEASGVVIAREVMARYQRLDPSGKLRFLQDLGSGFAPDAHTIREAYRRFEAEPSSANLRSLTNAVEPPRQEVIRRLNMGPGNTLHLVRMREELLDAIADHPELADIDADFQHLFSSWFNRGFLVMRRIDWMTPAHILEKIIRYEAVHAIESWDDLRRRLEPQDRRCFAFFHPSLIDEPLIFVEVALTQSIPEAIQPILLANRVPIAPETATTAVFYSISNCQKGLSKISFGNFLIKQVAEELKRECPSLTTFVTLSPVPGFRRWLEAEQLREPLSDEGGRAKIAALVSSPEPDEGLVRAAEPALRKAIARYLFLAKSASGQPRDPVQRFHLGNGARLERFNWMADLSANGMRQSFGMMVNYLYDLGQVEANHERYAQHGEVVAAQALRREVSSLIAGGAVAASGR
ncbi:MAG: malonyl-CoA decarboxylase [Methylocystis sp.]|nr:malonyl-CoA decarboxylase [Methylocystis sp.]MCA3583180.1 malonyl-CoA decarboxylase [Methylocystis sp.]MCA3587615.1 malonyl-CoA decarboxylase [Methylocystis sp.]MCA3590742.1 malonyl-CoA decarboxylase [Methylocystis sp.]